MDIPASRPRRRWRSAREGFAEHHLRLARDRIRAAAALDRLANIEERVEDPAGTGEPEIRSALARHRASEHRRQAVDLLAIARRGRR
jgi:hypothetical protein